MQNSLLPVIVAHGEGRVAAPHTSLHALQTGQQVVMQYTDSQGLPTQHYPLNPNGSAEAIASVCSVDGRATIMMPHPERLFRTVQHSWHPHDWGEDGPWLRIFRNARAALG